MSYTHLQGLDRRDWSGRRRSKSRKRRSGEGEGGKRSGAGGGPRSGYTRDARRCRTTLNSTATPPHPVSRTYFFRPPPVTLTPPREPINKECRMRSLARCLRRRRRRWRRRLLVDLRVRVARTSQKVSFGRRRHGRRRRAGRRGVPRGMQSGVGGPFRCCTFYVFLVFKRICTTEGVAPRPLRIICNSTTSTGRKL